MRENLREFVYDMYAVRERERMRSVGDSQREREREKDITQHNTTQHMYATEQCVRLFEHAIPNTVFVILGPNTVFLFWILAHCMYCLIVLFLFYFFQS